MLPSLRLEELETKKEQEAGNCLQVSKTFYVCFLPKPCHTLGARSCCGKAAPRSFQTLPPQLALTPGQGAFLLPRICQL